MSSPKFIFEATNVESNLYKLSLFCFTATRDHHCKVFLMDSDVDPVSRSKGHNLHVISVGTAFGHLLQVTLENTVDFFGGGGSVDHRGVESSSVLSLGVSTYSSSRVDVNVRLVLVGMLTHVLDDTGTDFAVRGLRPIELIGEGIEETVA